MTATRTAASETASGTASGVLRLELARLQLDDDIAFEARVIEKQVDEELVALDLDAVLPADEREAGAQLEQKPGDVADQRAFDVALVGFVAEAEEVEVVRVLQHLGRQLGLGRGQPLLATVFLGQLLHGLRD
jgi:hypothetical protein